MKRMPEVPPEEMLRLEEVMQSVAERNARSGRKLYAYVDTYGCQQNEADSEKLRGMLRKMGYDSTGDETQADIVVINSCAVREHAEMRIFGNIGALSHEKRARPDMIIAVCGCMVQQEHVSKRLKQSFPYVDLVFGPHELRHFPELLKRVLETRRRVFATEQSDGEVVEGLPIERDGNGAKAWLSIMYGCNNFCSYCIVPYVRGRERSRRPQAILDEAKGLIAAGYKDITLLGQNVNSYGRDHGELDFAGLLESIGELDGDFLIRFMTSHPKDATERLFEAMAGCKKIARHLHLPFQAGNDRVLKEMNRGYTAESYLRLIELARGMMPDLVLTSDVIVGFPGETDEEFEDTLTMIKTVRFDSLFTFLYSPRKGTPAAEMPDPFGKEEKQRRFERLLELQNAISAQKHAAYVGKVERVLIDGESDDPEYPLTSRTNGGRLVRLRGAGKERIGQFCDALVTSSTTWALFGEAEPPKNNG